MKKKILFLVSVLTLMFALCACGSDQTKMDYNGHSYTELEQTSQSMATSLDSLTDEQCAELYNMYSSSDEEEASMYADLIENWMNIKSEIGDMNGISDFDIVKAGKTLSAETIVDYSNRDVKLTLVYNANTMEMTAINVELVYSLGEKMQKAAMNTVMGISTVFVILILISLIIYCFKYIPSIQKKFSKKTDNGNETKKVVVAENAPVVENTTDDLELIAVISAAIAASTGASTDSFVVRSIKRR